MHQDCALRIVADNPRIHPGILLLIFVRTKMEYLPIYIKIIRYSKMPGPNPDIRMYGKIES